MSNEQKIDVRAWVDDATRAVEWCNDADKPIRMQAPAVADALRELIEAAGKAQDTNRDDYVLGRPDVSHLPEAERAVFLRGWDAASEAVFRTGLRAALVRVGGAK